jgi:hypothetical protein
MLEREKCEVARSVLGMREQFSVLHSEYENIKQLKETSRKKAPKDTSTWTNMTAPSVDSYA